MSVLMLMKALSHPGDGKSKCCIAGSWTCFSFLKKLAACDTALRFVASIRASWLAF